MSAAWLHHAEELLLAGADSCAEMARIASDAPPAHASLAADMRAVWEGCMEATLSGDIAQRLLAPLLALRTKAQLQAFDLAASLRASVQAHLSAGADDALLAQAQVLLLAVAALQDFIANNYTGPPTQISALLAHWPSELTDFVNEWASQKLRMDGEDVYEHSYHPLSLLLAKTIFLDSEIAASLSACESLPWWTMRYARTHQDLLEQNSATLKIQMDSVIPRAIATYCPPAVATATAATADGASASASAASASSESALSPSSAATSVSPLRHRLSIALYLEACHVYHSYWQYRAIDECLAAASRQLGVEVELTGLMGKRTRWQKEEKAQLMVRVIPSEKRVQQAEQEAKEEKHDVDPLLLELLPHSLALGSDVLLDTIALASHATTHLEGALSVPEQALLLAIFENTKRTKSSHITRDEENMAYITRVLQESTSGRDAHRSWAIECSALYHRSVLECQDKHAQDRALQQLEELSALFDRLHAPTTVASVAELANSKSIEQYAREDVIRVRMRDVYLSNYPSIWTLKQGIAATFQNIGLYKSALDLFESIHLYDGIIESCMLLGKLTQAESIIRGRLAEKPQDPKLLCLLSDCTRDVEGYERAWKVSMHTYPRAQRSLAHFHMQRNAHAQAIGHFQLALDLNPVFPAEWYAMGWCALEVKDFATAAMAFSRTVSFDPEYGNAWNNLAAAHLHTKNKPQAFSALEQAVKFKNDSWKLWENYMVTAVDLHEYGKAISAMERVVSLKANLNTAGEKEARLEAEEKTGEAGKKIVDEQVLTILHRVVMDVARREGKDAFLLTRFLQLLRKIAEVVVNHPLVYSCLADVLEARGEATDALLMREQEVRFLQAAGWSDSLERAQDVVRAHELLIEAYLRADTRSQLQAAKFTLDALLAKLRKSPAVSEVAQGQQAIAQIEGLLARVQAAMPTAKVTLTAAAAAGGGARLPSGSSSSLNIWR